MREDGRGKREDGRGKMYHETRLDNRDHENTF
jgi:hypothetical protein